MGKYRSKTGCLICRTRRVKCDEVRPMCGHCGKKNRQCNWEAAGLIVRQYQPGKGLAGDEVGKHSASDHLDSHGPSASNTTTPVLLHQESGRSSSLPSIASPADGSVNAPGSRRLSAFGSASLLPGSSYFAPQLSRAPPLCLSLTRHEATLVHHYAEHLGKWLDCTDGTGQFTLVIPVLVKQCPILLNAVLAFAARHCQDNATAEQAYQHCTGLLIQRLESENIVHDDALLCAIVILRFVEQLNVHQLTGLDLEQHLRGSSAILRASQGPTIDPSAPTLRQAAFWVFVRQSLYTATVNQVPPNLDVSLQLQPRATPHAFDDPSLGLKQETAWANTMLWLCARVAHFCFDGVGIEMASRMERWNELLAAVQRWNNERVASFDAIWFGPAGVNSVFPEFYFTAPWHAMSFGMYHFASMLLITYKPTPRFATRNVSGKLTDADYQVLTHARSICGSALCSPSNVAIIILLCHTVFIWGPLMLDTDERHTVLGMLANLEAMHS